jgi:hypothetical protein
MIFFYEIWMLYDIGRNNGDGSNEGKGRREDAVAPELSKDCQNIAG